MASEYLTTELRAALAPLQIVKSPGFPDLLQGNGTQYAMAVSGSGSAELDGTFDVAQLEAIAAFIRAAI